MIRLTKEPCPQVLVENSSVWTAPWVQHVLFKKPISQAEEARYRHVQIKARLRIETSDKCAYCESKITQVYYGDVEHMIPKRRIPELFVAWGNLTLACKICNTNKAQYYDPALPLLDPYADDPTDHLRFHGPLVFHVSGSVRGQVTSLTVDLKRPALTERRAERIESLKTLIDAWSSCTIESLKALLLEGVKTELSSEVEYAGALRDFARDHAGIEI